LIDSAKACRGILKGARGIKRGARGMQGR